MADGGAEETWTTKEVIADLKTDIVAHLDKQDVAIETISTKIDSKADKADLVVVVAKVAQHEEDIQEFKHQRTFRRRAWAVAGSVAGVAAIIGGALIGTLIH